MYIQNNLPIKAWAEEDRPREKLMLKGKNALSNAELIAILIGSGSRKQTAVELSKEILNHADNNLNKLGKCSVSDLMEFKGIRYVAHLPPFYQGAAIQVAASLNEYQWRYQFQ